MFRPAIFTNDFMDSVFDDFFRDSYWPTVRSRNVNSMSTDIREKDGAYEIDMELPGFTKEDVQAELKDGYLTITASHKEEKEEKGENQKYLRRERYSGCYQRSFYVGDAVTQEDIKAKFSNGVLTMTVPKVEKQPEVEEKKYIAIED